VNGGAVFDVRAGGVGNLAGHVRILCAGGGVGGLEISQIPEGPNGSTGFKFTVDNTGIGGTPLQVMKVQFVDQSSPNTPLRTVAGFEQDGDLILVGGLATYNNAYGSDLRLKKEVSQISGVLPKLDSLRAVSFRWKEEEFPKGSSPLAAGRQIGLIAQEVEKVFPELVSEVNGRKFLDYARMTAVLLEAVKELSSKDDRLEERCVTLERELEELKAARR